MTNEERDLIARYIARVGGAPQQGGFLPGAAGSVPQSQPALPPIDREADQFIKQQFQQYPEAPYRITQTALVQEAALAEMTNRVNRLQWELEQTRNAMQQQGASAQPQQPSSRAAFSAICSAAANSSSSRSAAALGAGSPAMPRNISRPARRRSRNIRRTTSPACSSAAAPAFSARR